MYILLPHKQMTMQLLQPGTIFFEKQNFSLKTIRYNSSITKKRSHFLFISTKTPNYDANTPEDKPYITLRFPYNTNL